MWMAILTSSIDMRLQRENKNHGINDIYNIYIYDIYIYYIYIMILCRYCDAPPLSTNSGKQKFTEIPC